MLLLQHTIAIAASTAIFFLSQLVVTKEEMYQWIQF